MSYPEGLEALQNGAFARAVSLLEQAAAASDFRSETVNHAYTLALYRAGDLRRLADVAFEMGSRAVQDSPGLALDYFQRALIAGLDSERVRHVGRLHEQWAVPPSRERRPRGSVQKVAHVVASLSADNEAARHIRMLCDGLRAHGTGSAVFSTESDASRFFNPSADRDSDLVELDAEVWRAPVDGNWLNRAQAIAQAISASNPDVVLCHSSFFEQVTTRVAAFRPAPLQVHVNHDVEIDADLFDARIHRSGRALAGTRYPDSSVPWIPRSSDVAARMTAEAPISRRAMGIDTATSVSATFGNLDEVCSPGYIAALTELLVRFPTHFHLFAGQGNVRSARQTLHAEGVLPRVRFLGPFSNVAPLLPALDFYLVPYPRLDPEFVVDAMGAGKPVVVHRKATDSNGDRGSDLVGVDDLIADNQTAYVEAASRIIRKSNVRESVTEAIRQRFAAEYTPAAMAKRYLDLFDKLSASR